MLLPVNQSVNQSMHPVLLAPLNAKRGYLCPLCWPAAEGAHCADPRSVSSSALPILVPSHLLISQCETPGAHTKIVPTAFRPAGTTTVPTPWPSDSWPACSMFPPAARGIETDLPGVKGAKTVVHPARPVRGTSQRLSKLRQTRRANDWWREPEICPTSCAQSWLSALGGKAESIVSLAKAVARWTL